MSLPSVTIPSAVSNYGWDYRNIRNFCKDNDPVIIRIPYENRSIIDFKLQPNDPAALEIKTIIQRVANERMAACRQEDVDYRLELAQKTIELLKESIEKNKEKS